MVPAWPRRPHGAQAPNTRDAGRRRLGCNRIRARRILRPSAAPAVRRPRRDHGSGRANTRDRSGTPHRRSRPRRYAMALQNTSLTNGGLTTNFQVEYQDTFYTSLPPSQASQVQNNLIANANFLLGLVEGAFTTTTGWFGTDTTKFGTPNRQQVYLDLPDNKGANNTG